MENPQTFIQYLRKHWEWILFFVICTVIVYVRIRLASMPLERDEGEYAYMAQLMLKGAPPYTEAYAMKVPGIFAVYSFILSIFGQTDSGIRYALLFVNFLTSMVIFGIGFKIKDRSTGIWMAATYLIISLSPKLLGLSANCEHFILLPISIGVFLLINPTSRNLLLSGLFFGLGVCIKQQAILLVLSGFTWAFLDALTTPKQDPKSSPLKSIIIFSLGVIIPILAMLCWMKFFGDFAAFQFWCYDYAKHYGNMWGINEAWEHFKFSFIPFAKEHFFILILSIASFIYTWKSRRRFFWAILILSCGAFSATTPGLNFRQHYFLYLALPLSLTVGFIVSSSKFGKTLGVLALFLPIFFEYPTLFRASPNDVVRTIYPFNAFRETKEIGNWISTVTQPNEQIGIFGSEPEICFYSHRHLATPYIYIYPLMEPQPFAAAIQKNFMDTMEKNPPKILIHMRLPSSWLMYPDSDTTLLEWIPSYLKEHYDMKKEITVPTKDTTRWNIVIYQRKTL
jgi:hypothetical protein